MSVFKPVYVSAVVVCLAGSSPPSLGASLGIVAQVKGAPAPAQWLQSPLRKNWVTDPLVIDCSFQMMILWSQEIRGAVSLPCFAGRYRQYQRRFPTDSVQIVVQVKSTGRHKVLADIEFIDAQGKLVARIDDYECVVDGSLERAFRDNQLRSDG